MGRRLYGAPLFTVLPWDMGKQCAPVSILLSRSAACWRGPMELPFGAQGMAGHDEWSHTLQGPVCYTLHLLYPIPLALYDPVCYRRSCAWWATRASGLKASLHQSCQPCQPCEPSPWIRLSEPHSELQGFRWYRRPEPSACAKTNVRVLCQ